jgi:uncharacterized protein YegL
MQKRIITIFFVFFLFSINIFICCRQPEKKPFRFSRQEEINLYEREGTPIDIILLLDQSASMSGYGNTPPTDPNNLRIEASKYFIINLARRSEYEPFLKIGIINFGTTIRNEFIHDLTPVTSSPDDQRVINLLNFLKPLSLGYTSFIRALESAYQLFIKGRTLQEKRRPIIVIFTDGEPDDERHLTLDEYFKEIEKFYNNSLKKINCAIFIIGIDAAQGTWSKTLPYWKDFLEEGNILKIESMEELHQKYNEIVQKIFYLPVTTPDVVSDSLDFEVQPYLEKIQFDIYPETKGIEVEITDSGGRKLSEADPNVYIKEYPTYKTIIVSSPSPGIWKYKIVKGKGKVKIYKILIPNKMKLVSPSLRHAFGRPFEVIFAFLKEDDTEVELLPEYPLIFTGRIVSPDGKIFRLEFRKEEKGIYRSEKIFNPESEGIYKIVIIGTGREGFEIKSEFSIDVIMVPYIKVNYPINNAAIKGYRNNLNVEVMLMYEGKPINPYKFFETDPNSLIWTQLVYLPGGRKSRMVVPLEPSEEEIGKFQGIITEPLKEKGQYILKIELFGKLVYTGEICRDVVTIRFNLTPSFVNYILSYWYIYFLAIAIGIGSIATNFYLRRAKLEGYFIINGEIYYLRGYKATIGGKKARIKITNEFDDVIAYVKGYWIKNIDTGVRTKELNLYYKSSLEDKNYDTITLYDGWSGNIFGRIFKYKKN